MITPATTVQRGCGKGRNPHRVRGHLMMRGLTMREVAQQAHTWRQIVEDTVRGMRNHGRVLDVLELYVPERELYPVLPRGHRSRRAA